MSIQNISTLSVFQVIYEKIVDNFGVKGSEPKNITTEPIGKLWTCEANGYNSKTCSLKKSIKSHCVMDHYQKETSESIWQTEKGLVVSSTSLLFFITILIKRNWVQKQKRSYIF